MHNLMGHMHLHSDSKPFKCLYCPSKFTLKGNLTRHMKVKHGIMDRGLDARGIISQQCLGHFKLTIFFIANQEWFLNNSPHASNIAFSLKYSGAEDGCVFPALFVSCHASAKTSLTIYPRRAILNSAFLSQMVKAVRKMTTACTG